MREFLWELDSVKLSDRIANLNEKMQMRPRYLSVEQAHIITQSYKANKDKPVIFKRAWALHDALCGIAIEIDPSELIVGNRAVGSKTGIVFPESGVSWVHNEIDALPTRSQDKFLVNDKDKGEFVKEIYPFWKGKTLEDEIYAEIGDELDLYSSVVKINQKDHAQGHICPNVEEWLRYGPAGLKAQVDEKAAVASGAQKVFYEAVSITLDGACRFIERYAVLAQDIASKEPDPGLAASLKKVAENCRKLSRCAPETYYEAIQAVWFLFVLLQAESNASSFSPGRLDQILYPYYENDKKHNRIDTARALEIMEAVWIKFNEIVYMRNTNSAAYFAGFPIGFNIIVGGQHEDGSDATNELSYIILKAQQHLRLPQPNLSVRVYKNSPEMFIRRCVDVIRLGTGMPQIFNDESIIPALEEIGIEHADAMNYAVTGCVEITSVGNDLGWSDAAMVNMVKILELTLNNGVCMQTGRPDRPYAG